MGTLSGSKMPRRKSPQTLEKLCIDTLARIFHFVSNFVRINNLVLVPSFCDEDNFFQFCPNWLMKEIFDAFVSLVLEESSELPVCKEILKIFLNGKMELVDLSRMPIDKEDWEEVLEVLIANSSHIKKFCLWRDIEYEETKEKQLELIRKLNLKNLLCDLGSRMTRVLQLDLGGVWFDKLFDVIGKNCPNLVILEGVSEFVTDDAMMCLYVNINDPADTSPRCQKLQVISAIGDIFSVECIMGLLSHLPQLSYLYNFDVSTALIDTHKEDFLITEKRYKLKNFIFKDFSGLLSKILVKVCPLVTELFIINPTEIDLLILAELRHVKTLTLRLTRHFYYRNFFDTSIVPFTVTVGRNIEDLRLTLEKIDLFFIDYFCPQLKILHCFHVETIKKTNNFISSQPFKCLRDLAININLIEEESLNNFVQVLSTCCDLQSLNIELANGSTNDLLERVLRRNPLKTLRKLLLYEGFNVYAIQYLLNQEDTDLEEMFLITKNAELESQLRRIIDVHLIKNLKLEVTLILNDF